MKQIFDDLVQYLRREGTADSLQQCESVLGQKRLLLVLTKLSAKMVFFEQCLPLELRTDWNWCHDLRQLFLLCPNIRQLFDLEDNLVDYLHTISNDQKLEMANLLVKKRKLPLSPPYYPFDEK